MKPLIDQMPWRLTLPRNLLMLLALGLLAAGCGSSQSPTTPVAGGEPTVTECDADNSTAGTDDDCGDVYIGLTDADGDFVTYSVGVTSLTLRRADGTLVETLPSQAQVDFAQYTELTEFLTAASVPPGTYVSGKISLNYSDAEIVVENGTEMSEAVIVDASGQAIATTEMELILDNRRQLVVRRGLPSLLTVDFDLGASHEVDLDASPVTAVAEPFLLAEVDPVDSKELRLRGPLRAVNIEESAYSIRIRPFHLRDGDFGRARVHTDSSTVFEVDGASYEGEAGLEAMAALPTGTPTVAFGELNLLNREYLAARVYAGSSVPGFDFDVVRGSVIAREGNVLSVRGAILVPRTGHARFLHNAKVLMGDGTTIIKDGQDQPLDLSAVSVGQRIGAFGSFSANPETGIVLDATEGRVRMLLTHLNGTINRVVSGQMDLALRSIDRRPVGIFDFTGTGLSSDVDANPENYEVDTGTLDLSEAAEGAPVTVFGYVEPFGAAPPDFNARSVADYSDARALLAIGWGLSGTATPFVSLEPEGIVLDLANPEIGTRHHIRQGGLFIDLLTLPMSPLIVPRPELPGVYAIKQGSRTWIHSDFAVFVADLGRRLDGSTRVRGMFVQGGYASDASLFTATRIGVLLD